MPLTTTASPIWEEMGGTVDDDGNAEFTRKYMVTFIGDGAIAAGEPNAIAACPVTQFEPLGAGYYGALVKTAEAKRLAPPGPTQAVWHVTFHCDNKPLKARHLGPPTALDPTSPQKPDNGPSGDRQGTPAPDRKPQWKFATKIVEYHDPVGKDANGVIFLNTAGEIVTGQANPESHTVISIKFWSLKITEDHMASYRNKTNSDTWYIYLGSSSLGGFNGTLLVNKFDGEPRYDLIADGVYGKVWECDLELEWNKRGWHRPILNAGLNCLDDDGELVPIYLFDGTKVSKPYPLMADGTKWDGDVANLNFLTYVPYKNAVFADMII